MHITQKIQVLTSNLYKKAEYQALGLRVIDGDVREVQGTPDEVILHKVMSVDPYTVVEDTITVIDNIPIVDWKYTFADYAQDGKDFVWQVRLAYRDEDKIYVFNGQCSCKFYLPDESVPTTPHFDSYTKIPAFSDLTLEELKKTDNWGGIDPRARALYELTWHSPTLTVPISMMKPWDGEYQE